MKLRTLTIVIAMLLAAITAIAGEELPRCPASAEECEHKIREAMTGKKYLGLIFYDTERGILVKAVVAESPAEEAGLKPGDLIVRVNGQNCADGNVKLFKKLVEKAQKKGVVQIRVKRGGSYLDIESRLTQITEKQIRRVIDAHIKAAHSEEKTSLGESRQPRR